MWERLGTIRGGQMPRSVVWRTPGLLFLTRSGGGSVRPPPTLPPSPPQTPPINLPSQIPPSPSQAIMPTPPQMLLSNLSIGSTDWQESGKHHLRDRFEKVAKIPHV